MGQEIAARLVEEGHDITVAVDNNAGCLGEVSNCVDAMVLFGNGADYTVLTEAGVGDADLLIAVTSDDSVNMLCCLTGKKLGVKNTVARVRTMEYFRQMVFLKDELGLSLVLNPEQAAAAEISRILRFPSAAKVESFAKGAPRWSVSRCRRATPSAACASRNCVTATAAVSSFARLNTAGTSSSRRAITSSRRATL